MDIFQIVLIFGTLISFLVFLPDIFPKCDCCRWFKPRFMFRIHETIKISLGYNAVVAVCTKCCKCKDIKTINEYNLVKKATRKAYIEYLKH